MRKISSIDKKILLELNGKRFLITGAAGMLGSSFAKQIKKYTKNTKVFNFNKQQLNVSQKKSFIKIRNINPDFIIHCAALVNADLCEKKKLSAKKNILEGTKNVIKFSKLKNSKIFYPQTFLIYGDSKLKVNEKTAPRPLSIYGKYKLKSERAIIRSRKDSLIVRMGGFFGGEEKDKNFVGKITKHISQLIKMRVNELAIGDRIWQPTFTDDLAYNSLILIARDKKGVYNMASEGSCSFYDLTKKIVKYLGLSKKIKIKKISAKKIGKKELAKRPLSLIMENKRLIKENLNRQRGWQTSLKEYISSNYFKSLYR